MRLSMMPDYQPPTFYAPSFTCPHCKAISGMSWTFIKDGDIYPKETLSSKQREEFHVLSSEYHGFSYIDEPESHIEASAKYNQRMHIAVCHNLICNEISVWYDKKMVFPKRIDAPPPREDTPEHIKQDYEEARNILEYSPRGAAALMRLCIQKLCKEIGGDGKNINDDIKKLYKNNIIDQRTERQLHILRIVGNEAVHPGALDLKDDPQTVMAMFRIFNRIIDATITRDKDINETEAMLPQNKLATTKP